MQGTFASRALCEYGEWSGGSGGEGSTTWNRGGSEGAASSLRRGACAGQGPAGRTLWPDVARWHRCCSGGFSTRYGGPPEGAAELGFAVEQREEVAHQGTPGLGRAATSIAGGTELAAAATGGGERRRRGTAATQSAAAQPRRGTPGLGRAATSIAGGAELAAAVTGGGERRRRGTAATQSAAAQPRRGARACERRTTSRRHPDEGTACRSIRYLRTNFETAHGWHGFRQQPTGEGTATCRWWASVESAADRSRWSRGGGCRFCSWSHHQGEGPATQRRRRRAAIVIIGRRRQRQPAD
mmetsp:Transcript_60312/g.197319  ORF Transcript_60312/g.197319 Transcript_60312/m.197319 type:complete len:298 (+) Transcript_60312:5023-5916(+)